MRKILAAIPLLFLFSISAYGQGATGQMSAQGTTCAVSGACVTTPTIPPSAGAAAFTISGNAGGNTIQFEASADNQTSWVALNVTPTNSTTAVTSATGNGTWQANIAGYTNVRLRTSTYVSGTPQGTINISYASARSGGGGGGGGTVTAVTGTAPITSTGGTTPAIGCATCTVTIANGTAALGTSAISSGACATVVTVAGTGIATTDNIQATFNADPTSTTGYAPSANGMLTIISYPTSGNVNFKVCNNTAGSITPGAVTLNWRVVR